MSSDKETIFTKNIIDLPNEILENIFAQLPLPATLSVYSLVCKSWAKVISNPFFLPWKKFYLSLKLRRTTTMTAVLLNPSRHEERLFLHSIMNDLIEKHNLDDLISLFPNVIRFMGKVHKAPENFESFCKSFKQHRLFSLAFDFLHWAPDELISRPFNMWHVITTVIILSEDVWDVHNVINLLLSSSNLNTVDVIEALYSLASVFLYAYRQLSFPSKYHYILYYALYLFESSWQPVNEKKSQSHMLHKGQQSMLKYVASNQEKTPTHEQATIVGHKIQKTDILKIVAFAGTGKTTTLLQFCKERPHLKFLLVVFNKSVQEHYNIFPKNTQVKTAHAIAFDRVGRKYSSIQKLDENLNPMKIVDILVDKKNSGNRYKRAGLVKKTLENFINSDSSCLTLNHVPLFGKTLNHVPLFGKHEKKLSDNFRLNVLLDDAQIVWQEMTLCLSSQRVNMTQDGQLKEWQLSKPKLFGYDVIMIDDGQDMNQAIFDIFLNQDLAKVIVGDPYQQIYSFRGATNAIQRINATRTYNLTQSFRFGPEISYVAHSILKCNLSDASSKTLVGGSTRDSILYNPEDQMDGMQRAYLCRTNFCLYKLGLALCKDAKYNDKLFAINGGLDKFGLEDILDIMKLADKQSENTNGNREVIQFSNEFFGQFESLERLISYANNVKDKELMNKINMYKYSGTNTTSDIALLRNKCKNSVKMADIVLSTIHKAKGLEWDWVIMADYRLPDRRQELDFHALETTKGEINFLYVAATRAKKRLTINTAILGALSFGLEKLEVFTSSSMLTRDTICTQCGVVCMTRERENASPPLVTKLQTLPLFNFKFHGGYICDKCSEFISFKVPRNPRRLADYAIQTYRRDGGRIARLALLKGKVYTPSQEQLPDSWDQYAGTPRV